MSDTTNSGKSQKIQDVLDGEGTGADLPPVNNGRAPFELIEIDGEYIIGNVILAEWGGWPRCLPAALAYARAGWKVFPAQIVGKTKKSHKSAKFSNGENWGMTRDLGEIKKDFMRWQDASVGIPCGAVNGIWVLEVDTKAGHEVDGIGSLKKLIEQYGPLPNTLMAESPSGSLHHYFRWPQDKIINNSQSEIDKGIDVRGEGGMVIAPPSVRGDGAYRWLNNFAIAEAPEWLVSLAIAASKKNSNNGAADTDADWTNGHESGGGGDDDGDGDGDGGSVDRLENICKQVREATNGHWDEARRKVYGFGGWVGGNGAYDIETARAALRKAARECKAPDDYVENIDRAFTSGVANPIRSSSNLRTEPVPVKVPEEPWPVLGEEALHGLAGEVVGTIAPNSESDPFALLLQFLVFFGNAADRGAYYYADGARHYTNLFALLIGQTAKARKGTSQRHIRNLFEFELGLLADQWAQECIKSGISSGEGVLHAIRDPLEGRSKEGKQIILDQGVSDKRLLLIEPEYASALAHMQRDGNTLSPILRDAWDSPPTLGVLTKKQPTTATNPHISFVGHITLDELRLKFNVDAAFNGFGNRFLHACVRRSQILPHGGILDHDAFNQFARQNFRGAEPRQTTKPRPRLGGVGADDRGSTRILEPHL
jgi:hypothetical protein